uniref:Abhydrolase domain containing 12B n=2 Tax=Kryptolebias marmoratus TaxID=37003 RepID=A0A3Q3B288_KRYMA
MWHLKPVPGGLFNWILSSVRVFCASVKTSVLLKTVKTSQSSRLSHRGRRQTSSRGYEASQLNIDLLFPVFHNTHAVRKRALSAHRNKKTGTQRFFEQRMALMKRAVSCLITVYLSVPVFLYLFPWILGHAIFSHLLRFPFSADLGRPQDVLNHTRNFYLSTEEDVSVGVWHTLPVSQWEAATGKTLDWYHETLGDGRPVIIYLHGNAGTRAMSHRVKLVKILSAAGYHVLSLDYRGFGDSTGEPSEAGLTRDALYLYQWVKERSRGTSVCLWGHSLGSGVATNAAIKIQEQGSFVDALILQAPYTRIGEVVVNHPIAKMYKLFSGFETLLWNLLEKNNIIFDNYENLKTLRSPLLILHSEDDRVVPYHMGQKVPCSFAVFGELPAASVAASCAETLGVPCIQLYQVSLQTRTESNSDVPVDMVSYGPTHGVTHSNIHLDPDLSNVVQ